MKESNLMRLCLLKLSEYGSRVFRNNTGVIKDKDGRYHRFGLAVGSSDIIGLTAVVITNEMVGKRIAVFTAIEVKSEKGIVSKEQKLFNQMVLDNGGIVGIARSPEQSLQIINKYLETLKE